VTLNSWFIITTTTSITGNTQDNIDSVTSSAGNAAATDTMSEYQNYYYEGNNNSLKFGSHSLRLWTNTRFVRTLVQQLFIFIAK
jgi:hypothetical protein